MSFKAKDLQFGFSHLLDNSQPAFLRRLRGELTGDNSGRHDLPIPRNKRMKNDDEDDVPTYVLEDTNQSLTKEEYDALVAGKSPDDDQKPDSEVASKDQGSEAKSKPKDKIVEVGATVKKRKAVKIISEEDEGVERGAEGDSRKIDSKAVKKPKKKAKAVKLTFGDEEEG
ncbi:hypothetical protein IQ07DRAFT_604961 [Pyrenochaeta sp. DS3sAY3a]|nr:hypothetical protein IQ07DRAFT_604961 [Pyrenochaeta sp. DS3sAY3a]